MLRWLFTWRGAAERPLLSAWVAAGLTMVGAAAIAYFRFANRDVPFSVIVGCAWGGIAFHQTRQRATAAVRGERAPTHPPRRDRANRPSLFEWVLIAGGAALLIASAVYETWSLVVPGLMFGGLGTVLIVLRQFSRRRA